MTIEYNKTDDTKNNGVSSWNDTIISAIMQKTMHERSGKYINFIGFGLTLRSASHL